MAMLYSVDASPRQSFSPLSSDPPALLTRDLPPAAEANCLLLGCGDPRNILYTLFHDENNGEQANSELF